MLDATRAEQIGLAYFQSRDRENLASGAYLLSPDSEGYEEFLHEAYLDKREALAEAAGERRTFSPKVVKLLLAEGAISKELADQVLASVLDSEAQPTGWSEALGGHTAFQRLCRIVEHADLELARRRYKSWAHGTIAPIEMEMFRTSTTVSNKPYTHVTESRRTLRDLRLLFESSKRDAVTSSRMAQYRVPFRVLSERFGDECAVSSVTRDDCRAILAFLPTIPSHATQHYKGKTLAAAADSHLQATGVAAERYEEASKHLNVLKRSFDFAVNEQWIVANPWDGLTIEAPRAQRKKHILKSATYEPFSIDQLNRIFALPLFTGSMDDEHRCDVPGPTVVRRHRYWAPIVALWTGMRMNEILQLEREDVSVTSDGIWCVSVTDQEHGQYEQQEFTKRLKTKGSVRSIPLHPFLTRIGFIEWVKRRPRGRLFPEATSVSGGKPSDRFSKRFHTNLKQAGISASRRLVFHSFRNNFNDALRHAGIPEEERKAINGWSDSRSMDGRYGKGHSISHLYEQICKVGYSGLRIGDCLG